MTWQVAAVRYVAIGEKSARFRDLTLGFTLDGDPVETVVWLPNGGGKSSLMSLKSAVVLPAARDFTGSGRETGEKRPRRLEDYVGTGDTSHTVIDWTADDQTSLFGDRHRILTGAAYEWPERRRPANDGDAHLNKLWWSAVPMPGVLDLDRLPFREGRLLPLSTFRDRLRQLNAEHPELQVRIAIVQTAWEEQLGALGIDTALYRYQARMNTDEGGISKIFRFSTVRDFVDLVVDVVAHPDQGVDCSSVLREHAKNLFRRPALETERGFLGASHALLTSLREAQAAVTSAGDTRIRSHRRACRLRAALLLSSRRRSAAAETAADRAATLLEETTAARRERGRIDGVRAELLRLAALDRRQQANAVLAEREVEEGTARLTLAECSAAGPLAEAAKHDVTAEEIRKQLRPEREAREQLRARLDLFAAATRVLLDERASHLDTNAAEARAAARTASDRVTTIESDLLHQRDLLAKAAARGGRSRGLLEAHERDVATARKAGILEPAEAPAEAVSRHEALTEGAVAVVVEHKQLAERHTHQAGLAGAQARIAAGDLARGLAEAQSLAQDEQALAHRHGTIAGDPRLIQLAEADGAINVWGDAARLRSALTAAARDADAHALSEAVTAADGDRLVAAVDGAGLLPAPVATAEAAACLSSAGVVAETAWTVLARDFSDAARDAAARLRPDVVSGIVMQDDSARARAVKLLASSPTLAHIPLVTAAELASAAAGTSDALVVPSVPLHRGLHDVDSAILAADGLREASTHRAQQRSVFVDRAEADRALLRNLTAFLGDHPHNDSLARARAAVDAARREAAAASERGEASAAAAAMHSELAERATELAGAAELRALGLRRDSEVAGALAEAAALAQAHRDTIAAEAEAAAAATLAIQALEGEQRVERTAVAAHTLTQQTAEYKAAAIREQANGVISADSSAALDADAVNDASGQGLRTCLARYHSLREQWQSASSSSVLEERLAGTETQARNARHRADAIINEHEGDRLALRVRAHELAREADVDHSQHQARATRELEAAVVAAAEARSELKRRTQTVEDTAAPRDRARHTTEVVDFTTADAAEAEAEQLQIHANGLSSRETTMTAERAQLGAEADRESAAADTLSDLADRLPADPATDSVHEAFGGDLAAARTEVGATARDLDEATAALTTVTAVRAGLALEALHLAASPLYRELSLSLRERLSEGDAAVLGAKAGDYVDEVELRLAQIAALFEQVRADEEHVTTVVGGHVRKLLTAIAGAARASRLPAGLGELSGQQFLNLRFANPSEDELTSRVGQEILSALETAHGDLKSLPSGESLLRRCVHAAVGVKGFRAEVLKPNEHMLEHRVPVTDVARFSDGEKLTTCVLLFCAFARMRRRGAVTGGGATGTLMLDNPFGKASTAQLVALQLAVAKAQQVHLVYATGLEDMGALVQFRRISRLRNRKPVGTTDGHVQHEADTGRRGEVTGVSVARPDAPSPVVPAATASARTHDDENLDLHPEA